MIHPATGNWQKDCRSCAEGMAARSPRERWGSSFICRSPVSRCAGLVRRNMWRMHAGRWRCPLRMKIMPDCLQYRRKQTCQKKRNRLYYRRKVKNFPDEDFQLKAVHATGGLVEHHREYVCRKAGRLGTRSVSNQAAFLIFIRKSRRRTDKFTHRPQRERQKEESR